MIREIWRIVADIWLFASLLVGWVVFCMAPVAHWGWPPTIMSIIAIAPFVVLLILAIVGQVLIWVERARK